MKKLISLVAVLGAVVLLSANVMAMLPPSVSVTYHPVYLQEVDANGFIWAMGDSLKPVGWVHSSSMDTDLVRTADRFLTESKLSEKYQLPRLAYAYIKTAKVKLPVAYQWQCSTADNGPVTREYEALYIGVEKKQEIKPVETTKPSDQKRTDAVSAVPTPAVPKLPATGSSEFTVALLAAVALIGVGLFTFRKA